jgi:signal transduction histidine kinase/CheY-like chemotaxis protein
MKTISKQILASLLVTVLVVLGGMGYWDLKSTMRLERENLEHDQKNVADRLADSLVYPLWNLNQEEIKKTIQNEMVEVNVRAILLYDETGEFYAGMIRETAEDGVMPYNANATLHRQLIATNKDFVTRDIVKSHKVIGKIALYANDEHLQSVLQQQRLKLAYKLAIFLIVFSVVQFFVLRRIIIQPLTRLKEWVSSIEANKILPPPKLAHCEEIDALALSFSEVTARLTVTLNEIVEKNTELQKRKIELQDRNEKLVATEDMLRQKIHESERNQMLLADEINERKHAEGEIIKLNAELEQRVTERTVQLEVAIKDLSIARDVSEAATRAKSRFLANMSHEIRTPMNAILGYTQLMQRLPELTGKLKNYTTIIARSGDHLLALINDILEMSKIEAGSITLQAEDVNLRGLMRDIESMLKMRATEKGLALAFDINPRVPMAMHTDATKLRQVLVNIIGNAIKFTDQGSIDIRAIVQSSDAQTVVVGIEISDTGSGIAEHEKSKVFDPFEQTESGHRKGGTGLGMAISREYARMMGGDLTFDSTPGKGTTVHFTFIAQQRQDNVNDTPTVAAKSIRDLAPDSAQPKILIVDDVESNREILRLLLKDVGFTEIQEVSDGKKVQAVVKLWQPDIVLMDRRMPGMDGLQATRVIRELPEAQNTRVIMVTASAFEEDRRLALASGADGFISKPFHASEILHELHRVFPAIVYRYEDISNTALPLSTGNHDWQADMAGMGAGLASELIDLIECGDIVRFEQVIAERLSDTAPLLCKHLQTLAAQFDYKNISAILQQPITS